MALQSSSTYYVKKNLELKKNINETIYFSCSGIQNSFNIQM